MFNKPLSIDYIRKLKKPQSVPTALDLNNGLQSFQGSLLEEWLLQTLDEHIQTSIDQYQVGKFKISNNETATFIDDFTYQFSNNADLDDSNDTKYLKKQEANFYIQQFLTNLIALGVLEFESTFENAINKTFKVKKILDTTHIITHLY
jgi:hypothetical protein